MTRVPAIPAPTNDNLREVARAVKGVIDVREGLLGDPLDRFVTLRELNVVSDSAAAAQAAATSSGSSSTTNTTTTPIGTDPGAYDPETDTTIPPGPEDFSVTGLFASVKLDWGLPLILNYAYTEVWAADINDLNEAVMIGTSATQMYLDYLGTKKGRLYWIRFGSEANVTGPYNDTRGTYGATVPDPGLLLESLTGQITESELYADLGARINLIDSPGTGLVTQVTNINGKYTVKIDNAGHVSGYGLISTSNNGEPASAFGIRADQFWIAPPAINSNTAPTTNLYKGKVWVDTSVLPTVTRYYNGSTWTTSPSALPFVVQASPTVGANGVAIPAGVYIDGAFIKNATITQAQINSVAADTIQAGYTSSVDLESSKFFGSEFYIGGTVTYKYGDPTRPTRKTGIQSVSAPSVSFNSAGASFTVDTFKVKTDPTALATPVFEVLGSSVRMKQAYVNGLAVTDANGNVILSAGTLLNYSYINPSPGWLNSALEPSIAAATSTANEAKSTSSTALSTANTALNSLSVKLNKNGDTITGRINFTVSDGLFAGSDLNNGCYFGNGGLFGRRGGRNTFYIDTRGNAVFGGQLDAATGVFAGDLSAAGGTFTGNLSAVGGTFTGTLVGVGGTFSGTLSANTVVTENIVSGALTDTSDSSSSGYSVYIYVYIPPGTKSVVWQGYSGDQYSTGNPEQGYTYQFPTAWFYVNGSLGLSFSGARGGLIADPPPGGYSIELRRDVISGVMSVYAQVNKR